MDLFGVDWDTLQTNHVRAFLEAATDEGITWEAKGDDPRGNWEPRGVRKAVCAFANSTLGGYVIVGATYDKASKKWTLPGLKNAPFGPISDWLSRIIRDGLDPAVRPLIKGWDLDPWPVAVIRVEPAAVPPVLTIDGLIYERVVGESVRVDKPDALARLFGRGEAARQGARSSAFEVGTRNRPDVDGYPIRLSVTVSPTAWPADIRARLLRESSAKEAVQSIVALTRIPEGGQRMHTEPFSSVAITKPTPSGAECVLVASGPAIRITRWWDSTFDRTAPTAAQLTSGGNLKAIADQLARLSEVFGGYGPTYLVASITDRTGSTLTQGWLNVPAAGEAELKWFEDELARGLGIQVWEPEA